MNSVAENECVQSAVLIVEDVEQDLKLLTELAKEAAPGCEVITASTYESALPLFRRHLRRIVLCLVDQSLNSEKTGADFVRFVRVHAPYTPSVIVTLDDGDEPLHLATAAGATAFIPKRLLNNDSDRIVTILKFFIGVHAQWKTVYQEEHFRCSRDLAHMINRRLGPIVESLDNLKDIFNTVSDDGTETQVRTLVESCNAIVDLTKRCLEDNKALTYTSINPASVQMTHFLTHVVSTFGSSVNRIQLDAESAVLVCDVTKLERAIGALLENSLEYSNGPVEVKGRISSQDANIYEIEVRDFGPGVDESLGDEIFLTARRGENVKKTEGFGYGLAIAKHYADLHVSSNCQGYVTYKNNLQGTSFFLCIPTDISYHEHESNT